MYIIVYIYSHVCICEYMQRLMAKAFIRSGCPQHPKGSCLRKGIPIERPMSWIVLGQDQNSEDGRTEFENDFVLITRLFERRIFVGKNIGWTSIVLKLSSLSVKFHTNPYNNSSIRRVLSYVFPPGGHRHFQSRAHHCCVASWLCPS